MSIRIKKLLYVLITTNILKNNLFINIQKHQNQSITQCLLESIDWKHISAVFFLMPSVQIMRSSSYMACLPVVG